MLTDSQRQMLLEKLGPLLAEVRAAGRAEIEAQNEASIRTTGNPRFQAGRLATMASWPSVALPGPYSDGGPGVEFVAGPDGRLYGFRRGPETTYTEHRAGWKALRRELEIIREVLNLGSDEEAHALLPELHSDFSYGVLVLALRMMDGTLCTPVAIRSQAVGSNQGMLTLFGGFVHPCESLFAAAERQLAAEGKLRVRFRRWAAWGPHNAAQSATFVLPADVVDEPSIGLDPPQDAWEFEGKTSTWVPVRELLELLVDHRNRAWFLDHFARLGLVRDEIVVATDLVQPLLRVISTLGLPRNEHGILVANRS